VARGRGSLVSPRVELDLLLTHERLMGLMRLFDSPTAREDLRLSKGSGVVGVAGQAS